MDLGVSTSCFYPTLLEDSLRMVGESGIKTTEIFLNTLSEMTPEFIGELCRIRDFYGMNIVSFHPFTSGYEPYLLFQSYTRRTADSFDFYKRYFSIAATLGAKIFILHGDKTESKLPAEEYFSRFSKLSDVAAKEGIVLCQENVNKFRASNPKFVRDMVKALGKQAMFVYDVKQAIRSGNSPWEMYDAMRGHILHMHLSDSTEEKDCLLPGNGDFNFEKLFRIADADGFDGNALIEVYSSAYVYPEQVFSSLRTLKMRLDSILY